MTKYIATIAHHSIARAREITISGDLAQAKRAATREFKGDHLDYEVQVYIDLPGREPELVARRRLRDSRWTNIQA